jgi:DNA-binding CsgD family transcriptional regulator
MTRSSTKLGNETRPTGIDPVPEMPWGSHLCLFYDAPADLVEVQGGYFSAGLSANELCVWALWNPVDPQWVISSLRSEIKDLDAHLSSGAMQIVSAYEWFLSGEPFDPKRITAGWRAQLETALSRGYDGLRISGNAFWMENSQWNVFKEYEHELDKALEGAPMLVLCTFSLHSARAVDMLDVARTHNFTIIRRGGRWEYLETPELKSARAQIRRLENAVDVLSSPFPGSERLTQRERLTLAQIVRGASSKEAAQALEVSPRTVEFHRANIMRKLDVRNTAELVGLVLRQRTA